MMALAARRRVSRCRQDEHRRIFRGGANGRVCRSASRLPTTSPGPPVTSQQAGVFVFCTRRGTNPSVGFLMTPRDVFNAGPHERSLSFIGAHRRGGATRRALRDARFVKARQAAHFQAAHILTMFAAQSGDRMGAGRDRADHAERRVLLQRNAVVTAKRIGAQPGHAGPPA